MNDQTKLTAYEIHPGASDGWALRPASHKRTWMETNGNHAYRCLPLVVANHLGWVIECPVGFTAVWNGDPTNDFAKKEALTFDFDENPEAWEEEINGHFGNGIITFGLPWLFQTDENVGLIVRGPANAWKANAHPLDGFIETWWLPFRFTMNWKVIKPNVPVRFEKGDPLCMLYPYSTKMVSGSAPEVRPIADNPDLKDEYEKWSFMRYVINTTDLKDAMPGFVNKYTRGQDYSGSSEDDHKKRIPVPNFEDKRN